MFADEAVDIQGPVVEEAVLLQAPVRALQARLAALLVEWPDHPLLLQLDAISQRLLGVPSHAPCKTVTLIINGMYAAIVSVPCAWLLIHLAGALHHRDLKLLC